MVDWGIEGKSAMLKVLDVSKTYKKPLVRALSDVSFSISRGETVGLVGPNGAGKTTLIKIILSLLIPSGGTVEIGGMNVRDHRYEVLRKIGATLEGARNLYWRLSLRDNLLYFGQIKGVPASVINHRIPDILGSLHLDGLDRRLVGTFSSGQKQRAALAVALIHSPNILILDEPTATLDIPSIDDLVAVLTALRQEQNLTLLISSHNLAFVQSVVDRVLFIDKGHLVGDMPISELERRNAEGAYLFTLEAREGLRSKVTKLFPEAQLWEKGENLDVVMAVPPGDTLSSFLGKMEKHGITVLSAERLNKDLLTVYHEMLGEGTTHDE